MRSRSVTLVEVARHAGVSRTTASYVLNDRADQMRLAPDTVARVRSAADELGYRPNRSAQNLRTATTRTFGLVSDHVAGGHYGSTMLVGAGTAAHRCDHLLVVGETHGDPEVERLMIEEMLERRVDGIAYARLVTAQVEVPASLREHRTVLLNCVDPDGAYPAVLPDERAGGRTAAEALLRHGITGAVYVVGEDPTPEALAGPLRLAGLTERLAEAHAPPAGVLPCSWAVGDAYDTVHRWLAGGGRPAALVCLNDRVAMGAYQALADHGLDVPGDVSVVSFDGSELAGWLRPPVVSVEVPYAALGARAVELLTGPPPAPGARWLAMPESPGRSLRERS